MDSNPAKQKRKILLVEDDIAVREIVKEILEPYTSDVEILEAGDAGKAMDLLFSDFPRNRIEAIILDIMMTYGTATEVLDAASDPDLVDTGVRFLRFLRQKEEEIMAPSGHTPIWVSVITARSGIKVILTIQNLLGGRGRIYLKPFDDMVLEHDWALVLGLESQVDEELLPDDYARPAT